MNNKKGDCDYYYDHEFSKIAILFPEVEANSEQLFIEMEVNRPGYSPGRKCGKTNILSFSPTLR